MTDNEAAAYRRRLRETENQRDNLTAQLASLQRAQVDQIIESLGIKPQAVWKAGISLDALLGQDGEVDAALVAAATTLAAESLGITPTMTRPGLAGLRSGNMQPPPPTDGWVTAFTPSGGT